MGGQPGSDQKPRVDPWTSLNLRAYALELARRELDGETYLRRQREAYFASLDRQGLLGELGLALKDPAVEMPWMSETNRNRPELHLFWTAYHAMYPPDWDEKLRRTSDGDPTAIESAIVFLEADPWCHRSGYVKEDICRWLRKPELTDDQKARIRVALIDKIRRGPRREFRSYCHLAKAVDSPDFRSQLRALNENAYAYRSIGLYGDHPGSAAERARWMIEALVRANGD